VNLFEYLFVVIGVILGLGITELLEGASRTLRGELQWGKLHTLWVLITFQLQVQMAWGLWGLHDRESWRYTEFLLLLIGPVVLYMAASVLYPGTAEVMADDHFIQRRKPFFLLMAIYVFFTGVVGPLLYVEPITFSTTIQRLIPIIILVILSISDRRRVHWLLGPLILAGNLWFTYMYTFTVSATPTNP
jgi:hypothetical protein